MAYESCLTRYGFLRVSPVKPPPCLSADEIAAIAARYRAALCAEAPAVRESAEQWLARSSPPNWALEWSLPVWLGDTLGVAASAARDLVFANVFGLTYIRLQDALSDGEIPGAERPQALALATRLFEHWKAAYGGLFAGDPAFWACFEQFLSQWMRAIESSTRLPEKPFSAYSEADFLLLGHRGAPIKICAAASCILADRDALLPDLEAALDALMIGAVLLDHAADWREDLRVGRPNAFVAYASPLPQTAELQGANRAAVLALLAAGDGGRPYFALIADRLGSAGRRARVLRLKPLARYVAWLRGEVVRFSRCLAREPHLQLQASVGALFAGPDALPTS